MGRTNVRVNERVQAPIEDVFERLIDHEGMAKWPRISKSIVIIAGEPRNGLGAVRAITAGGVKLLEEVVHYEPPHRYDYTITKGLPVDHLGSVRLVESDGGVDISWEVNIESRVPLLAQALGLVLRRGLPPALAFVKREAEEH